MHDFQTSVFLKTRGGNFRPKPGPQFVSHQHAGMISDQVPLCNHGREMFGQSQVSNSFPTSMQARYPISAVMQPREGNVRPKPGLQFVAH